MRHSFACITHILQAQTRDMRHPHSQVSHTHKRSLALCLAYETKLKMKKTRNEKTKSIGNNSKHVNIIMFIIR